MNSKKPLILVVDDIPKNLQVIGNLLNKEGYEIAVASNGYEALDAINDTKPDLILLDIMMPEMDGYEVAQKVMDNPETSGIPIIFITGRADISDIVKGFKIGAVDYITKPFNVLELLSRVNTHISLKTTQDNLKQKNDELDKAKEELEKTIASKDKFFSIIAHDLKGPFSGFIGLSSMLADELDAFSQDEIAKIGKNMHSAANRLYSLLENLLNWSRTQTDGMQYNPEYLNLSKIIEKNFKIQKQTASNKNIRLISEIDSNAKIYADVNMMDTIFRNLISNSIKFTKPEGRVVIYAEDYNDFLKIIVEDTGIGMTEQVRKKVFSIEHKISTKGTNMEQGTGLGLILCKELVEMHGGEINLESEINKGTKFFFTIPKAKIN